MRFIKSVIKMRLNFFYADIAWKLVVWWIKVIFLLHKNIIKLLQPYIETYTHNHKNTKMHKTALITCIETYSHNYKNRKNHWHFHPTNHYRWFAPVPPLWTACHQLLRASAASLVYVMQQTTIGIDLNV